MYRKNSSVGSGVAVGVGVTVGASVGVLLTAVAVGVDSVIGEPMDAVGSDVADGSGTTVAEPSHARAVTAIIARTNSIANLYGKNFLIVDKPLTANRPPVIRVSRV